MQRLSKATYSEQVAQLIKQRIRSGKLRAGESIGEAGMAEECGISRAPVREALYQLEAEGLLMSHPSRGKCVTILTPEGIRNSYELSGLLEGTAAANAAKGMPEGVRRKLSSVIERMREAVREGSTFEEHASLGTEFHEAILCLSDNPLLRTLASRTSRVISKYLMYQQWRTLYSPEELYLRHNIIYEALCAGKREQIENAVREHYADSAERLAKYCDATAPKRSRKGKAHFPAE